MQEFLTWLAEGALGPALFALPVTAAAGVLTDRARRWLRRLRRSAGLSRVLLSAAGDWAGLTSDEFAAVRELLEKEDTWELAGRGTVEDLAHHIESCLSGRTAEEGLAAARTIAAGVLEFAAGDLEPELFKALVFARLERMEARQASAFDQVMLVVHADLVALLAVQDTADAGRFRDLADRMSQVLDQLPPAPADRGEVAAYLAALARWLNADPWPQDARFVGPILTPSAIEQRLRIKRDRGEIVLDADTVARECSRLAILGGPGSGKTWLARRTARLCAETALQKLKDGALIDEVELPLYTTCARLLAAPPSDGIRRAIVSGALGQLPDLGGERILDSLKAMFEERDAPTLLVADSLDEAPGADDRIRQADTLPHRWRIILTSRPGSWNGQLTVGGHPGRESGELQPLRYPQDVEAFIARWFAARPEWTADLTAQLRERPALQQAATVPLILTFYCLLTGAQPLPARRSELYRRVIRRMLSGGWRRGSTRAPDLDTCQEILREWAWSAAVSDQVSGLGAWVDEFPTSRIALDRGDLDALDHVAVPLGPEDLDTGKTLRRFVHRSVCEHLVAEYIAFTMPAGRATSELLGHLWYDPDWEHAAPSALAMHPERDQVLEELMRLVSGVAQFRVDFDTIDDCRQIRRFLAMAAPESAEADWSNEAARLIGQARKDLADTATYRFHQLIATDWPASNRQVRESLLGRLDRHRTYLRGFPTEEVVAVLSGLGPTAEDRARARKALLRLLAIDPGRSYRLPESFRCLAVTEAERAQTREALLGLLGRDDFPKPRPGGILLSTRRDDRARASAELVARVGETFARLAETEQEQAQAREVLLRLLTNPASRRAAPKLGMLVAELEPTGEDRAQASEALLSALLSPDPEWPLWIRSGIASSAMQLAVTKQERAKIRESLLTLVIGTRSSMEAQYLTVAIAQLDPTPEDRARARMAVLKLLATRFPLIDTHRLPEAFARLAVAEHERVQTRRILLSKLVAGASSLARELAGALSEYQRQGAAPPLARLHAFRWVAMPFDYQWWRPWGEWDFRKLAEIFLTLAPPPEELAQARQSLLSLLDVHWHTWDLACAITRLDPTLEDQERLVDALLEILDYQGRPENNPRGGRAFNSISGARGIPRDGLSVIKGLRVAEEKREQMRKALLRTVAAGMDHFDATEAAEIIAELEPAEEDLAFLRAELFKVLTGETDPEAVTGLTAALMVLATTPQEQARVRQILLRLLTETMSPAKGDEKLAHAIALMNPTVEEQANARATLGRLHADGTGCASPLPYISGTRLPATCVLLALAKLSPTPADLDGCDSWRCSLTSELLSAVRRNSKLDTWLAILPLLARKNA